MPLLSPEQTWDENAVKKSTRLARLSFMLVCLSMAVPAIASADSSMPRIVHEACTEFVRGRPYTISARFEDESQLFDPKVIYRTRAGGHWKHASFKKDGDEFHVVLLPREMRKQLEYFIEVFDEFGNGPARMGSPDAPIKLKAAKGAEACEQIPKNTEVVVMATGSPEPKPTPVTPVTPPVKLKEPQGECSNEVRPLYCEPWLWGGVGAVVLTGIGIGIYFIAFDGDPDKNVPGTIQLRAFGPNVTGAQ